MSGKHLMRWWVLWSSCLLGSAAHAQNLGAWDANIQAQTELVQHTVTRFGPNHRETGRATLALAQALEGAQEYKPAHAHFQRALSILDVDGAPQDRVLAHLGVARGAERRNEGDKVLENCSRAWELQSRLPPDSNQLLIIKICVGRAQVMLGNLAKAAAVGRELAQMAMATTDAPVAWRLEASSQAGSYCVAGGDYASARQVAQWQLELARKQLPPDSTQYADMLNSAVAALTHVGDVQTALPYAVLAQDLNQKLRGELHQHTRLSFSNLGWIHVGLGRYLEAKAWFVRALNASRSTGRPHFIDVHNLGEIELLLGELDAAHDHFSFALETATVVYSANHPLLAWPLRGLARVALAKGQLPVAAELSQKAVTLRRPLGVHPDLADALQTLGDVQLAQSKHDAARASYDESRKLRVMTFGDKHAFVADSDFALAEVDVALSNFAVASRRHTAALALRLQTIPVEHPKVAESVEAFGRVSLQAGDLAEAARRMATVWKIRRAVFGQDHPLVRAAALRAQELCAEAETPCLGDVQLQRAALEPRSLLKAPTQ